MAFHTILRQSILLLFLLSFYLSANARQISILGNVEQGEEKAMRIKMLKNSLSGESMVYSIPLKEDATFGISFDPGTEEWAVLQYGDFEMDLFVGGRGDQRLELSFNALNPIETIRFSGSDAANNTFLSNYRRLFSNHSIKPVNYEDGGLLTLIDGEIARKARAYAAYDYFQNLDRQFQAQRQYLHSQTNLNPSFFMYFDKAIGWQYELNKIAYLLINKDRLSIEDVRMYWGRYAILQSTDINDDKSVCYAGYRNLLTAFIHYLGVENPGDESAKDLAFYRFVNGNISGRSGFYMLARLILDNYQRDSNPRLAHRRFKSFKRDNPYQEYTQTLVSIMGPNLEYVPQKAVPDFSGKGLNNELVYLSDFGGRVVYISFWASWCAPCLKGFRQTNRIRKDLAGNGVILINVNLDDKEEIWKRSLSNLDLPGINIYADNLAVLQKEMNFKTLPHYILVNKSGLLTYLSSADLNAVAPEFYQLLRE